MAKRDRARSVSFSLLIAVCVGGCGGGGAAAPGAGGAGGAAGNATAGRDGGAGSAGGGAAGGGTGGQLAAGGAAGSAAGGGSAGQPGGAPGCGRAWVGDLQRGTPQDDEITAVTAAEGGGFYVTGYEGGDDQSSDVIPAGDARAIVARYDGAGALMWETGIDTPAADTAEDVQVDPATGNLVVAGRTSGAFSGFQNAGQMDMYVMVLHSSGDAVGAIQIGDERPQHPVRLALGAGKIVVAGYDDIFIPSNFVAAYPHGFLAQFSVSAAPAFTLTKDSWTRSALFNSPPPPPSNEDFTTGVAVDVARDGAIYVSSTVNGTASLRGMFITKLDASGQTVWSNRFSSNPGEFVSAVALSPNGDLIVAGAATLVLAGTELGQQDGFVAKIDKATGAVQWATAVGSPESDFATALAFDAAGNIYVTGQTLGTLAGATPNPGGVDVFVAKVGPSGGVLSAWQKGRRRGRPRGRCSRRSLRLRVRRWLHDRQPRARSPECRRPRHVPPKGRSLIGGRR